MVRALLADHPSGARRYVAGGTVPLQSRRAVVAGVAVLAVLLGGLVWWVSRGDGSDPAEADPSSAPTSSATQTSTPTPTTSSDPASPTSTPSPSTDEAPQEPTASPPSRPPVDLDEQADFGDGVRASLQRVRRVSVEGRGPGEVSGPGVQIAIRIVNDRAEPLDVGAVVVNATWGEDDAPATQVDSGSRPFAGRLDAGGRARGVYVFDVPPEGLDDLTVTVSHSALSPIVVFTGEVE